MLLTSPLFRILRRWCMIPTSLVFIVLSSCSSTPDKEEPVSEAIDQPNLKALPSTEINDSKAFEEDTLYSLIAAELALTRAHYNLGLSSYVDQARYSLDVNVTARAAQVARILKRHSESLEMAELWRELDPGSQEARFILVSEYTHAQQYDQAFEQAQELLEAGYSAGFEDIAVAAVDNKSTHLDTLTVNFEQLLSRYQNNSALRVGLSIIYQHQQRLDAALTQIVIATELDPDNVRVIYQKYRVLHEQGKTDAAAQTYSRLVELQPSNFRVRSRYAHQLIRVDLVKAMEQYQILHDQRPDNSEVLLNLGLLQLDQKLYDDAELSFTDLLKREKHLSISNFSLAEVKKAKGNLQAALEHYLKVESGNRYVDAISNAADILTQKEGFDNALLFIANRRANASDKDKEDLYLVEGDALQRRGHESRALEVFSKGIESFPQSVTLLYSRAMLFASQNETALAEKDFKQVLQIAPESAMVLNALGYTLLDQTERIEEAGSFIEKAYELNPDDVATIDSMGWLAFKRGDTKRAITFLRQAMDALVDDEIASHLGEALWSAGRKKEARNVLRQGLEHNNESPFIKEVLQRLNIEL